MKLYNLKDDIGERKNIANSQTDKRDELLADLLSWQKSAQAVVAHEPNPSYKPADASGEPTAKKKGKKKNQ